MVIIEWRSGHARQPGEPDTIWWRGDPLDDLIEHPADLPDEYRHSPPPPNPSGVKPE